MRARRIAGCAMLALAVAAAGAAAWLAGSAALEERAYDDLGEVTAAAGGGRDWEALSGAAPGAAAWIAVEGTPIDYPVAEPGDGVPRGYYLSHDIWGRRSAAGCPYVDPRTSADAPHVLVYGHRMGWSGRMFGSLWDAWRQESFERIGRAVWSTRAAGDLELEPLCALRAPAGFAGIQEFSFASDGALAEWLAGICRQAMARSDGWEALAAGATRALTLVTCTQAEAGAPERTIVVFCA